MSVWYGRLLLERKESVLIKCRCGKYFLSIFLEKKSSFALNNHVSVSVAIVGLNFFGGIQQKDERNKEKKNYKIRRRIVKCRLNKRLVI